MSELDVLYRCGTEAQSSVSVDAAGEVEPRTFGRTRFGFRRGHEKIVGSLGRFGPGLISTGHELGTAVAVHVSLDPVEVKQAMIRAIGDHPAQLSVESIDQPRRAWARPANREMQRARDEWN